MAAAERVIRSGWWVLGREVQAFEQAWALHCGTAHAVGVANGLDAIEIGLRALGIGPGDEVITTPVTAYATTLAIQRCGALPVFADIDPSTACLATESVATCIGPATRAVLPVHLYGRAADLDGLEELCRSHGLHLVEDCAQAHGARHLDRPVGSVGRCAAWSFYPTKNLGAIGDAGALTTADAELARVARSLRNYGQSDRYHHDLAGMNSRLDELQAALLSERLGWLDAWTHRRREIAGHYRSRIHHPLLTPMAEPQDPSSHVHHLYVLRTPQREWVQAQLAEQGVSTLIHYPLPCTRQKALAGHRIAPGGIPHALEHCRTCFSLPIHPFLQDDEVKRVIDACNELPDAPA
nr:DegT/DnrJ/EryC1/StrS family aminotransferase [Synechococcus sp. CCY 9618]